MQYYFEFTENEYYALVAVKVGEGLRQSYRRAAEIYVDHTSGDSVEEVIAEAMPKPRTREAAFMKFMRGGGHEDEKVGDLIKEFDSIEDGVLLIDGSLL